MAGEYEREQNRLLRLLADTSDAEETDPSNHDPFSDDGEYGSDPNFEPHDDESSSGCSLPIRLSSPENYGQLSPSSEEDLQENEAGSDGEKVQKQGEARQIEEPEEWTENVKEIPVFPFNSDEVGEKLNLHPGMTPLEVFSAVFTPDILNLLVQCTNEYGNTVCNMNKPSTRYSRKSKFRETNAQEMKKFIGLCLLQAQVSIPHRRQLFTTNPLYFHPIFLHVMSGRRYEQLLQCLSVAPKSSKGMAKVNPLLNMLISSFQSSYSPQKELSLDESLLLHRGRLSFRTYMKGKKAKYGIKFYELTSADGYVLNIEIYSANKEEVKCSKIDDLVCRLMKPYLNKGHFIYMDNYYNSVSLSNTLLQQKTHSVGTLRGNRKRNPKVVVSKKLKKGEYIWRRQGHVYISKWKDKRDVLVITTANHPELIEVANRYGAIKIKPKEISLYNKYMSGVDRCDQMTSYYSSPRKTIKWNKKVIFHLIDLSVWNSFYLYKKNINNIRFLKFRDELIKQLIEIEDNLTSHDILRKLSIHSNRLEKKKHTQVDVTPQVPAIGHFPEKIPLQMGAKRKNHFLRCKVCTKNGKRKETSYRCKACKIALCPECFEEGHTS